MSDTKSSSVELQLLQARLLEEYRVNVELWKHDDMLRQERNSTFLTATTLLLAVVGIVASGQPRADLLAGAALVAACFGLVVCGIWNRAQRRNAEYVRFRRFQLCEIEDQLADLSTFANTVSALNDHEEIRGRAGSFSISPKGKKSSTLVEGHLPNAIALLWLGVAVGSVATIVL
jgi:hypothetical protein